MLDGINENTLFFLVFLTLCAVLEFAFRFGRRRRAQHDEVTRTHFNGLQAALLGPLALLLHNHVPETVLYLLMIVAMGSFGFIACRWMSRASSADRDPRRCDA
jgi:hypothetical protein